jgi:hypothetical protein
MAKYNGMAMTWQWHGNDVAMTWHGMAMTWQWHGKDMAMTWQYHGMILHCDCHVVCHDIAMMLPCYCHVFAMLLPVSLTWQ